MGAVPVNNDDFKDRESGEQSSHMQYESKDITSGVVVGVQGSGSSGKDESRRNDSSVNKNNGSSGVNVSGGFQIPLQPLGPVIRWEKFLPTRSLKVLLVENDDSTRHVVTALLRNCCYEVVASPDALQAWRLLEDHTNRIDLVLTEVVMPFLSGIGLLCKIMSHKNLKNIPVIMMSSHDSMGLVFKSLSKGAVDFLVKPIRKNELKNLWQHVWRRCQSFTASGSESGTQTKNSARSRSNDESENNTCSCDEHDNGSNGLSNRDGSDNGSGTQSSWTKRAVAVDSQPTSPRKSGAPESTCAQVIHTKLETAANSWMCDTEMKEYREQYDHCRDDARLGKDLQVGPSENPDSQCECQPQKLSTQSMCKRQNKLPELDSKPLDMGQHNRNNEIMSAKSKNFAPKSSGIASSSPPKAESRDFSTPNDLTASSQDKAGRHSGELPSLELTLKQTRVADGGTAGPDDRNILRHSDLSAFSKYNTVSSANQIPAGNLESCSPLDNSSVGMKTETMQNYLSHSSGAPPNQRSNGSSNNDVASSNIVPPKAEGCNENPEAISAFRYSHSSAFHPLNGGPSLQPGVPGVKEDAIVNTSQARPRGSCHRIQIQHHHHHHHHYHHHVRRVQQSQLHRDEISLKKMASTSPQCGSSNAVPGATEGNSGNCSVNGSVSGSNHGSNGQNGGTTILNTGAENIESDHGAAGENGAGSISVRIRGNGADEDRLALREAALTKYRQKRKERHFEKRVRYQSRKRLAEQRPRVRGQFVRQIASDTSTGNDDNNSNNLVSEENSCDSAQ